MKYLLLMFFIVFSNISIFSQGDPISDLYNSEIYICGPAVDAIIYANMLDAYPHLVALYPSKPPIIQSVFLDAFFNLKESEVVFKDRLYDYIKRADSFIDEEFPLNPLNEKVHATYYLLLIGDNRYKDYVFELINSVGIDNINGYAFSSLPLLLNEPASEQQAKAFLLHLWDNPRPENNYSLLSMVSLTDKYGSEMTDKLISSFLSSSNLPQKMSSLKFLCSLNYSNLNTLLKNNISSEQFWSMRISIVDTLLTKFGSPSDLKAAIEYQPNEPNTTAKSLMVYSITNFIPPRPTVNTDQMINNLITYNTQLYQYGWIQDYNTCQQYAALLDKIENEYMTVSLNDLCDDLKILLAQTEINYNSHLITAEAYKFLHYHGIYIKENVETELGTCP